MADINDFKSKVLETLGNVADKTKDVAAVAAEKAKAYARIAKLSVEISGQKETIRKAYIEIGKLYYDLKRDDPDGVFTQLCEEVTLAIASIAVKETEIEGLKNSGAGDGVDVEFENAEPEEDAEAQSGGE